MDSNETQMLLGLVNSNARLVRLIQNCCNDLKNNGELIINDDDSNISKDDFNVGDFESRVHDLIRSFGRLEGVFTVVHSKEHDDLQSFLQQAKKEENEMKCRQNSSNILEKLTRFLHCWSEEMERLKGKIAGLKASKRRKVCRDNDNYAVDGTANEKIRLVECMILQKILSTLGW
ncbi:hypothetical protein SUGI_0211690 [Cryptomeria japonica]|nr:hypothetical protein SUGI_0211690 [Cryptomeria japonica]